MGKGAAMTIDPLRSLAEIQADIERILRGEAIAAEVEEARLHPLCYGDRDPHDVWVEMYERVKRRLLPHEHAFYLEGIAQRKREGPT